MLALAADGLLGGVAVVELDCLLSLTSVVLS
jgi:hypothetical protein